MDINSIFASCLALSESKRKDYTTGADNHQNFRRTQEIQSWFTKDIDKPYIVLISTKLARLASLLSDSRVPNNESIEDSFKDLINYCGLWAERRLDVPIAPKGLTSQIANSRADNSEQLKKPENKKKNYEYSDQDLDRL